jgi:hypothetical protein
MLESRPYKGGGLTRLPLTVRQRQQGVLPIPAPRVRVRQSEFVSYGISVDWIAKGELASSQAAGDLLSRKGVDCCAPHGGVGGRVKG